MQKQRKQTAVDKLYFREKFCIPLQTRIPTVLRILSGGKQNSVLVTLSCVFLWVNISVINLISYRNVTILPQ